MENTAISAEELRDLLESSNVDHVVTNEAITLTSNELNTLLDRTDLIAKQRGKPLQDVPHQPDSSTLFKVVEDHREP